MDCVVLNMLWGGTVKGEERDIFKNPRMMPCTVKGCI